MKQQHKLAFISVAVAFVLLVAASYECVIGLPTRIDGVWVQRQTIWHGVGLGCPIPYQRGTTYTFYKDDKGHEIRHGLYRRLHSNGVVSYRATYRHGEFDGVVTEWDHKGRKTNETIYSEGQCLGRAVFLNGKLHYHTEQLIENGHLTAWKRFENGRWFLTFPSDAPPVWQIDPSTGELSRLK